MARSMNAIMTYGMILPTIISNGRIGDTRICSIVPRSFSLTMLSAVRMAPTIIMITAMMPGTMKLTLLSSALYQTRLFTSIGAVATDVAGAAADWTGAVLPRPAG